MHLSHLINIRPTCSAQVHVQCCIMYVINHQPRSVPDYQPATASGWHLTYERLCVCAVSRVSYATAWCHCSRNSAVSESVKDSSGHRTDRVAVATRPMWHVHCSSSYRAQSCCRRHTRAGCQTSATSRPVSRQNSAARYKGLLTVAYIA